MFDINEGDRTLLIIDGSNLYSAAKSLGLELDFKRLLSAVKEEGRLVQAKYYTAISADPEEFSPIRGLVDFLDYNGYSLVTKPMKRFTDSQGVLRTKGNMDIEMAVDMVRMADHVDHIILFSGDGDFRRVVEAVQEKGVRVTVVSTMKSQPPQIADELRRQADCFLDLTTLAAVIGRTPPAPK
jgi:uncharacterized LabA/DUF88 family protein